MPDVLVQDSIGVADSVLVQSSNLVVIDSIDVTEQIVTSVINTLYVANVRALNSTRLRIDFTHPVVVNSALTNPNNYVIEPITPGASPIVPQSVDLPISDPTPSFVELEVTEMTDSAIYSLLLAGNIIGAGGETIDGVTLAFFAGIGDSPNLFLVLAVDKNTAQVQFTEPMENNAAIRDANNYSFDNGLVINSVESVQGSVVTLKTSDQTPGLLYTLTVRGILAAKISDAVVVSESLVTV